MKGKFQDKVLELIHNKANKRLRDNRKRESIKDIFLNLIEEYKSREGLAVKITMIYLIFL